MIAQFETAIADGDEVARLFRGGGGFCLQTAAAGRNQRQRQRGGFDEFPAGSMSVAHDGLVHTLTSVKSPEGMIRIFELVRSENMDVTGQV
jgi:hypothetical protein